MKQPSAAFVLELLLLCVCFFFFFSRFFVDILRAFYLYALCTRRQTIDSTQFVPHAVYLTLCAAIHCLPSPLSLSLSHSLSQVSEGSIAEEAGLCVEDVIVRINDTAATPLTHDEAHRLILSSGSVFYFGVHR